MGLRALESKASEAPSGAGPASPLEASSPANPMATSPPGAWLLFLVTFVALGSLPNQSLYWDDIGFLQLAVDGQRGDLAHLLYPPLIRLAMGLVAPFGLGAEAAARILSASGGGLVVVFAYRRARDLGLGPGPAGSAWAASASLLLIGAHLLWRQGSVVEPSTLALAALLATGERADRYGQTRSRAHLAWFLVAAALSCSLHVVTLVALPWWMWRARGTSLPRSHRIGLTAAGALAVLLFLALGPGPFAFVRRALSYMPHADTPSTALTTNIAHLFAVLREGAPALGLAALFGLLVAAGRRARPSLELCLLGLPHLVLFTIFGKPVVALSLPLFVVLFEITVRGIKRMVSGPAALASFATIALPVVATVGLGHALRHAFHLAAAPDERRELARLVAENAPSNIVLVAGPLARHLRWWTELEVIELPELMHEASARDEAPADANAVRALLPSLGSEELWVSREAIDYLAREWQVDATRWGADETGPGGGPSLFFPLAPSPGSPASSVPPGE